MSIVAAVASVSAGRFVEHRVLSEIFGSHVQRSRTDSSANRTYGGRAVLQKPIFLRTATAPKLLNRRSPRLQRSEANLFQQAVKIHLRVHTVLKPLAAPAHEFAMGRGVVKLRLPSSGVFPAPHLCFAIETAVMLTREFKPYTFVIR
ncbi:hypothetical protein EVAR_40519_1 [Eumeta japonica]|uniref:Uncharacterized protein n=1 Tax=Eumeta variegata TaxID=151549 RepID=A0A4C2AC56_EUMVA|nr:hypothetical protein EVAR_40519_1 [Eumeta japonica]